MKRILIAVLTCSRYLDRRNAIRDSWMGWVKKLNMNVEIKFFSGSRTAPSRLCGRLRSRR